jgi:hypothetical protein
MATVAAWGRAPLEALMFPTAVWRRVWRDAAIAVAVVICVARAAGVAWAGANDFHAYWSADLGQLYAGSAPGGVNAFLYSPLFAQVIEPLRWLPFNLALALWTALELASLIYLAGPWSLFLFVLLAPEWMDGNVHLVMAAAVFLALRRGATWSWSVPAFTKLAPAVGLAWFVFRGDWPAVRRAVATMAVLFGVSVVLAPELWVAWAQMLLSNAGSTTVFPGMIGVPLSVRLPFALVLLAWGARTNRRWTVPVACAMAMPLLWVSATFAFGIAAFRLATLPAWTTAWIPRRGGAREPALAPVPVTVGKL